MFVEMCIVIRAPISIRPFLITQQLRATHANFVYLTTSVWVGGVSLDVGMVSIAHDALCTMLAEVGVPMPIGKLVDAIAKAYELGMISGREEHWLRYFNRKANEAKHHGLPF
jgi:hypothetical protein